ncbi:Metallo-beta-lactamase_superfamily protein [Hexamita inflata]|uniref:Metallo-beta-lactamase superfamily protein n=1 Tax=Hexamita inflata TaxID=28002 RepID=A0AA86PXZ1_9EUKA|nr:Metallo-beta-lactamase superfamily protein [Hexamita inflata]
MSTVTRIDTNFLRGEFCGVFVVNQNNSFSIVEVGSTLSVPPILSYLEKNKISKESVRNIFITHVHLDHSGGAGLLLKELPNATIYTQAAGVTHIVDPHAKLVPGAVEVYGKEVFDADYPGIIGCDANRVKAMNENDVVDGFKFFEAPGHAFHHGMFFLEELGYLFSGDALGFGFKEMNLCPLLCTSPTQFDSKASLQTVQKMETLPIKVIQPTHFEPLTDIKGVLESCKRQLAVYENLIQTNDTQEDLKKHYIEAITEELNRYGSKSVEKAYEMIIGDINVAGLWYRVQKRLQKKK